jgi:hypothetical protein
MTTRTTTTTTRRRREETEDAEGLTIVQLEPRQKTNKEEETEELLLLSSYDSLTTNGISTITDGAAIRDIRSQRLSDTYPIRMAITDQSNNFLVRLYRRIIAHYFLRPLIHLLFPRVLNNQTLVQLLLGFRSTTQVKLLCAWTCDEGHICQYPEHHSGRHKCVFGHVEGVPILKCGHICDCRHCEGRCVYPPGHSGIHKCYFRHYPRDIPGTRAEQEAFRDDKAIGDYIDELAYSTSEDIKYSHVPETLDQKDENWTEIT